MIERIKTMIRKLLGWESPSLRHARLAKEFNRGVGEGIARVQCTTCNGTGIIKRYPERAFAEACLDCAIRH